MSFLRKWCPLSFVLFLAIIVSYAANESVAIRNPDKPLFGTLFFDLHQDLTIGNGSSDETSFFRVANIAVNSLGEIYVPDRSEFKILIFDSFGRFKRALGRRGQGPGEFSDIRTIAIDSKDQLYIDDAGFRLHIFDNSGRFVRTITYKEDFEALRQDFGIGAEGRIFSQTARFVVRDQVQGPKTIVDSIDILNDQGLKIKNVARFETETPGYFKLEGGYVQLNNYCVPELCSTAYNKDALIYAYSKEYALYITDSYGNTKRIISLDRKPLELSSSERKQIIKRFVEAVITPTKGSVNISEKDFHFPTYKPFFRKIICDDEGRIYVERFDLPFRRDKTSRYDVFDKAGRYIYDLTLPMKDPVIDHGNVYYLDVDSTDGYARVVRCRIANWSQLKS